MAISSSDSVLVEVVGMEPCQGSAADASWANNTGMDVATDKLYNGFMLPSASTFDGEHCLSDLLLFFYTAC
jgi:hypothetical protein